MLTSYQGYFNNGHFFSLENSVKKPIPENKMVIINVLDDVPVYKNRAQEQLKAFEEFFAAIKNSDEELGEDFDKIMSQRFNITRELDL